jgi:methylenetetrahydrofolate dehydrogenase (NADP+)/methenyltetrahydrofolate cyclohydrolase
LAESLGCRFVAERLAGDAELADVQAMIGKLNADPRITGILILRPMPTQVPEVDLYKMLDPAKDIEAVHPVNAGLLAQGRPRFIPSTPAACFYLLDAHVKSIGDDPASFYDGRTIVLVGRSHNVGKPALWLGLERNATVVSAHRHTFDAGRLPQVTRSADILIVAAGVAGLITGEMISDGVIAVDVGINPVEDTASGKVSLVGDLDFASVAERASAITPVPGGVGPITDVWLLRNTVAAAIGAQTDLAMSPWVRP